MGFGDGFYKQVPDNIVLDTSSPLFDNIVDDTVNLHVSTTGDDTNGDGSESNPYATPQRAVDSIPDNLAAGIRVEISCGAGTFEFPDTSNLQPRIQVEIIGDTSNPVFSIAAGSVPFNAIAGKYSRRRGNVGTYAESITDGSHWMLVDLSAFGVGKNGYVIQGSTSPDIDIIANIDPTSFGDSVIYAYATTFIMTRKNYSCKSVADLQYSGTVRIFGIEITATDNAVYLEGLSLHACKFSHSSSYFNLTVKRCYISSYTESNVSMSFQSENLISGCYLKGAVYSHAGGSSFSANLFTSVLYISLNGSAYIYDSDFEGSGTCIRPFYSCHVYIRNCSVASTRSSFIDVGYGNCFFTIEGTITGSVTGNAIVLRRGSQVTGAKTYCNGTLTAGGFEIVVGGDATEAPPTGRTFASLPATDLAATYPELCRAD